MYAPWSVREVAWPDDPVAAAEVFAAGDEVATTGGMLGKVVEVGEQFLTLEIASGVNIKLQKFQVAQVLPKGTVKNA